MSLAIEINCVVKLPTGEIGLVKSIKGGEAEVCLIFKTDKGGTRRVSIESLTVLASSLGVGGALMYAAPSVSVRFEGRGWRCRQ